MKIRDLKEIERDSPVVAKSMKAAGYFYSLQIASGGEPGSAICVQCGTSANPHRYGSAWCDVCLRWEKYLPIDYEEASTRILFRPFFDMLANTGEWALLKKFVVYFESRRADILAGRFTLDIESLVVGVEDKDIRCPECALLIGPARVGDFCSAKCYHKDYRRKNKEKLTQYQKNRREDREL